MQGAGEAHTVALACLGPGAGIGSRFNVQSLFQVHSPPFNKCQQCSLHGFLCVAMMTQFLKRKPEEGQIGGLAEMAEWVAKVLVWQPELGPWNPC